jgi:hypothetical protein
MSANIAYTKSSSTSRYLIPAGDGNIDVTQMAWTLTPNSGRVDVPTMYLTEFQQNVGQLISSVIYYTKAVANIANGSDGIITGTSNDENIYQYKYFAIPTGFSYKIPYFSPVKTNKTNTFSFENSQNPFDGLMGFAEKASLFKGGLLGTAAVGLDLAVNLANSLLPGKINLENPQSWSASTVADYTVTWDLYNTGTTDDIINNRNLAYILSYQNSPARRSAFIVDPPVIYSMYIPDIISMPACYVSSISITNLGNTRQMQLNGVNRVIPEGYRFSLTFKSLLMDTRNIMNGLDTGNRLSAIEDASTLSALSSNIMNGDFKKDSPNYKKAADNAAAVDRQYGLAPGTAERNAARANNLP